MTPDCSWREGTILYSCNIQFSSIQLYYKTDKIDSRWQQPSASGRRFHATVAKKNWAGPDWTGDRRREANKGISAGVTITHFGPALWTVVCYSGTSLSSSHRSPNGGLQSVFDWLWERTSHLGSSMGSVEKGGGGGEGGVSVDESDSGFCPCAYVLTTVWMCQRSAVRSARKVWSNRSHLRAKQRCPFLSRGGCD